MTLLALLSFALSASAAPPARPFFELSRPEIANALAKIHRDTPNLRDRIAAVSERYLGTPYRRSPEGEGATGEFDRHPTMEMSGVDCTTFVEQVMALSLESDLTRAQELLQRIRYKNGVIKYEDRNHFIEADWIANNTAAGFIRDITADVAGKFTRIERKKISKRAWYAAKTDADLVGFENVPADERAARLKRFRALGESMPDQIVELPYLPIENLPDLLDKIPSGTIANIIRSDIPTKIVIVSHQVLILRVGDQMIVRHAVDKDVVDRPALKYFQGFKKYSWPFLGVNLNEIRAPANPLPR